MNHLHLGELVPGTHVLRFGRAPRKSKSDRNLMGWFFCTRCHGRTEDGEESELFGFFEARVKDVRPGHTVSCGCKAKKQFIEHMQTKADNLPQATRESWFMLAHRRRRTTKKTGRICRLWSSEIARRFKVSRYLVDFAIASVCKAIRAKAKAGEQLKWWEKKWLKYAGTEAKPDPNIDIDDYTGEVVESKSSFLGRLHWSDRMRYIKQERAHTAACESAWSVVRKAAEEAWGSVSEWMASLEEGAIEIISVFRPIPGFTELNRHRLRAC